MDDHVRQFRDRYPLSGKLPAEIAARSHSWFTSYRAYPVFSAPWFWRRTAVFSLGALLIAAVQSALVWRLVDRQTGLTLTAFNIVVWQLLVIVGPALATLVRTREMARKHERIGVVLGVAIGIAVSFGCQHAGNRLSQEMVLPSAVKAGTVNQPTPQQQKVDPALIVSMITWQAVVFFMLSGGAALRSYFKEPALWRIAQGERELEALRQQKSEVDLKLAVLQAQVEPHFLFNTLASVHSLIRNDPTRAEATIEALVDHLRATLPKLRAGVGSPHSTLDTQLEVCRSYLEVMLVRMGNRLRYEIHVPQALREHPFPPYMLISLVENAVKHGIEPSAAGGCIQIHAAIDRNTPDPSLDVTVQDDGVGLRPGLSDGVGLVNLRSQLAAQFRARGRFSITGRSGGGVNATISLPYVET
jgi:LytS/YehU family sensor histidine kinase